MAKKAPAKKAVKEAATRAAKRPVKKTSAKAVKEAAKKAAKKAVAKKLAAKAPARNAEKRRFRTRLKKADLEEFRMTLLEKRRSLVGDMNMIEAEALRTNRHDGSGDLSNMPTHPADLGTDNFEQEFTLGLLESERLILSEIDEALRRIENGTYGVCMGTGKPIIKARLRAKPWAKYTIEYARMIEQGLVRPRSFEEDQFEEQLKG